MTSDKHILIGEDDSFLLTLLELQCQSLGMQTCGVVNGEQLVTEALSYKYDIVITDIQMPLCDGIEAMQILRRLGYDRPIFAMSADKIDCEGFDCTLQKPVDITQLAELFNQTPQQDRVPLLLNDELTALFYQNLLQLGQDFAVALQQEDLNLMRQICHKIKGGAASFGHQNLSHLADNLQQRLISETHNKDLLKECKQFLLIIQQSGVKNERT
ncbi:response regulator [Rheinheimera maricola]|uniref:Response regulator n=1 Tax=Rheinheimera maricola TaxID=2793282 RepID=A0ABS7XDW7_9GAMM|nr:response regulator [Rheinheimera maricola]MBZ9612782.1 response regulator [Rheinheimera maricola]